MTYTLSWLDQSFNSSVSPVYDAAFHFWRCKDVDGADFNVADPDGLTFVSTPVIETDATLIAYAAAIPQYEAAVQHFMDSAAKARGYDDLATAVSYADEPAVPRFQQEGRAFRAWRSLAWQACIDAHAAAAAGGVLPTLPGLLAALPKLTGLPD